MFRSINSFLLALLLLSGSAHATALSLSRDANGWTVFVPSSDSRIVYISESGDDTTCTYYAPTAVGGDVWNPSEITPCATYKKALTFAREGYPDWILFKRGETFTIDVAGSQSSLYGVVPTSGRGATEPSLTGSYGSSGSSPIIKIDVGVTEAIRISRGSPNWIAIDGLDFYSFTRDPSNAGYITPTGDQLGLNIYYGWDGSTVYNGILIEGCKFRFFDDNIATSLYNPMPDLTLRRNLFLDGYARVDADPTINQSHNQGLLITKQDPILEENIFIHNGWLGASGSGIGEATIFNHNVYTSSPVGATYKNNVFIQGSNMNTKFTADSFSSWAHSNASPIVIEGNLYIDGQQGIGFGNNSIGNTYPFANVSIKDNVFSNIGRQKNIQGISWGIDMSYDTLDADISNNVFMNQADPTVNNGNFALAMGGILTNISVHDNVTYNVLNTVWLKGLSNGSQNSTGSTKTNLSFANNIYSSSSAGYFVDTNTVTGYSFTGNTYYGDKSTSALFRVVSTEYGMTGWAGVSGDTSTFSEPTFTDPTRSIETYMTSLGQTATIDAFIAKCRAQDRYSWDTAYTAPVVNAYIRAGFDMTTTGGGEPQARLGSFFRGFKFSGLGN